MKTQSTFKTLPIAARYTIVLFFAAGLAAAVLSILCQPAFSARRLLLLLPITVLTARAKVNLFKGSTLSLLTSAVLLAVINEGPAVAVLLAVCGVIAQTLLPSKRLVLHQLAFNTGMIAVTVTATWWTYRLLADGQSEAPLSAVTIATVLASFTYFLGNSISVSLIISLTKRISMLRVWFDHFLYSAPSFVIAGFLSLGAIGLVSSHSFAVMMALLGAISIAYYCSVRVTAEPVRCGEGGNLGHRPPQKYSPTIGDIVARPYV